MNNSPKEPGSGALSFESSASPSGSTSPDICIRLPFWVLNPPRRFISERLNDERPEEAANTGVVDFTESAQAGAETNRSAADTISVDLRFMKSPRDGLSNRGATPQRSNRTKEMWRAAFC